MKGPPADAHDAGPGFKWKGPQLMLMMLAQAGLTPKGPAADVHDAGLEAGLR